MIRLILVLFLFGGIEAYSQSLDYARSIVNTLASESYKGRGYDFKGDLKAAEFIRNEFRNSGLSPLGKKYFQYFNLDANTFPGKMEVTLNERKLGPGINFIVDPASSALKGHFSILHIEKRNLNNPETLKLLVDSCKGKAVLIDMCDTSKYSKEEDESINKMISAIKYDPRLKNPLTIIFTDKKLTWSTSGWQAEKASIVVNSAGLEPETITGITVDIQAKLKKNYQTENVVGMVTGKSLPDSFLVITAHFDHLGTMGKNTWFPGANDNASGVAMMLNLCRYFSAYPPKYSMIFIAFSGEEAGLLGSEYFTKNPLYELGKTRFLVNFDLAGTGDEGIKVVNGSIFKPEFQELKDINDHHSYLKSVQPRGEACISDHCFFYNRKIPCFYIYTLGGISAYHDIFDKAETLPFTAFENYYLLMTSFFSNL